MLPQQAVCVILPYVTSASCLNDPKYYWLHEQVVSMIWLSISITVSVYLSKIPALFNAGIVHSLPEQVHYVISRFIHYLCKFHVWYHSLACVFYLCKLCTWSNSFQSSWQDGRGFHLAGQVMICDNITHPSWSPQLIGSSTYITILDIQCMKTAHNKTCKHVSV